MRLASWNINDVNKRLDLLLAWLKATQPDVVALQELKSTTDRFPRAALEALGYRCLVVGQKTWNGVALLARDAEPVPVLTALPGDPDDAQARYLEAAVHGVLVASLYAPNGNPQPGPKFDYKLAWMARLQARADEVSSAAHPMALIGDFNVVPTDADLYSPKSWLDNALLQPEPRQAYAALLKRGWTDALAQMEGGRSMYTFWDYRRNRWPRDAGLRIDHILLSKTLRPRLRTAGVDRAVRGVEGSSDHAPVWVDLA
ncbi:MAG TPA: exodeoxyribonuclease III [Methylibium sp.]|uniref:exodeoxyribonuclease III n=1 Tax=Methylibium sp. TaxID=2067992 RepID=UPI002DBC43BE|nr:exodeoxyribonuclease III [Methylibium sp.]HEU4460869.1 exodeoxyribonuclease III [Methylibium sp.]